MNASSSATVIARAQPVAPAAPPVETSAGRPPSAPVLPDPQQPRFGEAACNDVPATVGVLIVSSYVGILAAFALIFLGAFDVLFMLGVCAVYLTVYLGVPALFLRMEGRDQGGAHLAWGDFLARGLSTATGRTGATAALAQILTIPISVILAVFGIGLMMRVAA